MPTAVFLFSYPPNPFSQLPLQFSSPSSTPLFPFCLVKSRPPMNIKTT